MLWVGLPRLERNALYNQAAVFATRESGLAAELGFDVQRATDIAVRAAHVAALQAAEAIENGHPPPNVGALITAATGPGFEAIAREQTQELE